MPKLTHDQLLRSVEGATIQHSGTAVEHQDEKQQRLSSLTSKIEDILTSFPAEGTGLEGFSDAINLLSSYSVNTSSRGFLGKLVSGPSLPGIAADLYVSILNNNGHVWRTSPALSTVERHVSLELAKLFDLRGPYAGGVTVPGGAAGSMLAMLVARNIISPDVKIQGRASKKYAIFVSESAHYSISNAAQIVGLGSDSVIRVPTVDNEIMDMLSLENLVRAAVDSDKIPLMISHLSRCVKGELKTR
ncbi:hypothetical protein PFICI_09216 [Pestalotiopsis fici W106-1]|uniref:Glutamate decarboxylase n=1 Tax=Pestalotiopsis fici (strain W106-1 / CGMCC3.15140) TaxID=1229662 RepID=W3WZQ3_PESFW|nr:uncharacterized protein PFICI_09216 [Pestalotiopsis fici W106-1]ETS79363.1 hypothetical protein PFICI_09216 [Pestalotiopsis fici W106-1]